jgi:hypothetical protein
MTVESSPPNPVARIVSAAASAVVTAGVIAGVDGPVGPRPWPACPGLLELAAVAAASAADRVAVGPWLRATDAALAIAVAALVANIALRVSRSLPISVAAGVAAATLASASPTPLAAASAVILAAWVAVDGRSARSALIRSALALTASLITPKGALLFGAAGALLIQDGTAHRRRARWLMLAAAVPLAVAVLSLASGSTESLTACVVPLTDPVERARLFSSLGVIVQTGGLYLSALAVLGGLLAVTAPGVRLRHAVAIALFAGGSMLAGLEQLPSLPPALPVVVTLLAAIGARQLLESLHGRLPLRVAAAAFFTGLLPLTAVSARFQAQGSPSTDFGHDQLSLARMTTHLARVPAGAALVEEDARVSLLLRAAVLADHAVPRTINATPTVIARARLAGPVVALPYGQQFLKNRGFSLGDLLDAPGLASVESLGPCRALLADWRRLSDLERVETFAFVADRTADVGPIALYALFDARPELFSLDWPADAIPGFRWSRYVPRDGELRRAVEADRVPANALPLDDLFGIRLDLRRSPGSPLALATTFHRNPVAVFGRLDPAANQQRLSVCPASTHDVVGFGRD